jgi:hypothetical protein
MPILAYRAKQSTKTIGTGTLVLDAADTNARSFNAAFGASARRILYMIQFATGYEFGLGDFDGGSPGSLTRATVLASSNANALVTLAAGTKDVFAVFDPAAREVISISATATLALADLGNAVVFTGSSAATLNLPAVAASPLGAGWMVTNRGSATLTIDPSGTETINGANTLILAPTDSAFVFRDGSAWSAVRTSYGGPNVLAEAIANNSATLDITTGLDNTYDRYELELINLLPASNNVTAFLRIGTGAGPTWQSGAGAYNSHLRTMGTVSSTEVLGGGNAIWLSNTANVGNIAGGGISGTLRFYNPDAANFSRFEINTITISDAAASQANVGGGVYLTASAITGLRFLFSSGNINSGSIRLLGYRK